MMIYVFILLSFLFADDELKTTIGNVKKGNIDGAKKVLLKYQGLNPNNSSTMYLDALLEIDGNKAKDKFLESNNNTLINFLFRYVTIKPNDLEIYEDNDLNIILKAKQHLDLEEYNESLKQILILDPSGKYFKKWIDQLALFLEFELTLMKVE